MNDERIDDNAAAEAAEVTVKARKRRLAPKRGYSLLEILIVLTIIGMLVGLAGPKLMNLQSGAKAKAATVEIKSLKNGLDTMSLDIGRYPSQAEGLSLLIQSPGDSVANWKGPYIDSATVPNDPWSHPYLYTPPEENGGKEPLITSLGEDGKPGGTGNAADISS